MPIHIFSIGKMTMKMNILKIENNTDNQKYRAYKILARYLLY